MKKIFIMLLLISLFLGIDIVHADSEVVSKEEIEINLTPGAKSAIMIESSSGKILYNKNANEPLAVASLTKIMSLILIFETIEKGGLTYEEMVTVSENAKQMGGTQLWLETGEKISVNDLIKGITMVSANDAVVVLAERIAGTEEAFVKMMNKKTKELGLKNTNFMNSHGLDEEGHYSSAYDLAMMSLELIKHQDALKYTGIYESYIKENTANKTWISNTNKLVRFYEGADGLKTGATDDAGKCLAVTALRDNLRLITITLGYKNVDDRNKETSDLLDFGFNQYIATILQKKGNIIGKANIDKAKTTPIDLILEEDIVIVQKKTDKELVYNYDIDLKSLKFPIKKGEVIGTYIVKTGNEIVKKSSLIMQKDINKIGIISLYFNVIKDILIGNK